MDGALTDSRMTLARSILLFATLTILLAGCGIKGPLYLPAPIKTAPPSSQSTPTADLSKTGNTP